MKCGDDCSRKERARLLYKGVFKPVIDPIISNLFLSVDGFCYNDLEGYLLENTVSSKVSIERVKSRLLKSFSDEAVWDKFILAYLKNSNFKKVKTKGYISKKLKCLSLEERSNLIVVLFDNMIAGGLNFQVAKQVADLIGNPSIVKRVYASLCKSDDMHLFNINTIDSMDAYDRLNLPAYPDTSFNKPKTKPNKDCCSFLYALDRRALGISASDIVEDTAHSV
jgi:hypothetical protein